MNKRIVDDPLSRQTVWWVNVKVSIAEEVLGINLENSIDDINPGLLLYVDDTRKQDR